MNILRRTLLLLLLAAAPAAATQAPIVALSETAAGCLLALAAEQQGVYYACPPGMRFRRSSDAPEAFPAAAADAGDGLLLATSAGLYRADGPEGPWRRLHEAPAAEVVCAAPVEAGSGDKRNASTPCWTKLWGHGIHRIARERLVPLASTGLPGPLQRLAAGGDGDLLGAAFGHGIYRYENARDAWLPLAAQPASRNVLALAGDGSGALWAATWGGGLYRLAPQAHGWTRLAELPLRTVTALAVDSGNGALAAGPEGVWYAPGDGRQWEPVPVAATGPLALTFDRRGGWWAGGEGVFLRGKAAAAEPAPFAGAQHVAALAAGADGTVAAVVGPRVYVARAAQEWEPHPLPFALENRLSLAFDADGALYCGSPEQGLFRYADGRWSRDGGLPGIGVNALAAVGDGTLYAVPTAALDEANGDQRLYRLTPDGWQPIRAEGEYGDHYSVWNVYLTPSGEAVAWGLQDLLLSRDRRGTWERSRFGQFSSGPAYLDPAGAVWSERQMTTFVLRPGAEDWERAGPPALRYARPVALGDDRLAAVTADGRLMVAQRGEGGAVRVEAVHALPGAAPYHLAVVGERLLLGSAEGLFASDDLGAGWWEITPGL